MRTIKFRVRVKTGDRMWIYGDVLSMWFGNNRTAEIIVDKETLSQFTGLLDKNGKEIYEGDIVKYTRKHWYCIGHPEHNKDLLDICTIYWDDEKHAFGTDMRCPRHNDGMRVYSSGYLSFNDERADECIIEIIGNIYQNPELLS